jgi:sugar transferase EpsL
MSIPHFPARIPISKRLFDLLITIPGLIFASPLLALTALLLWITEGRPIVFSQARGGLNGKVFWIYKFRTMRTANDEHGNPLPDEKRISTLGKLLRAASLDELPELINVIRGEMSLVGPRPFMAKYLDRYTPEQMRRHEALPGITGWAQINGRNALTWEERFALDTWYIDNWSMWLDIKILALTIFKVTRREGINQAGHATMQEFQGTMQE